MSWLPRLWKDFTHGVRIFARQPMLAAIAVISIAFGTGGNVAIFSVADVMLLRPLPVADPARLLAVGPRVEIQQRAVHAASYPEYVDIRDRTTQLEDVAAYCYEDIGVADHAGATPRIHVASFVSDNYFDVLGVVPQLGRGFREGEADPDHPAAVLVLSDAVWRARFGADPQAVGRTVRIAGGEFTIVGVAPAHFTGLHQFVRESIFLPLGTIARVANRERPTPLDDREHRMLALKGRLRPGATLGDVRAELAVLEKDLAREHPAARVPALVAQTEFEFRLQQRPIDASLIAILATLSIAVLAVACANVAGLLASRGPERAREMAVRMAVGADRARLIRQLLTESLAIALAGAAAGLAVAQVGIAFLRGIRFPSDTIAPPTFELDDRALVFSLAVAMACALIVGLGPAVQTTRVDLTRALTSAGRTATGRRFTGRAVLVAVQVAVSLVLVTIAAFAVQLFGREVTGGPGFRTTQIAKATVDPGQAGYTSDEAAAFFARLVDDARALPGVRSASLTSAMPLFSWRFAPVMPENRADLDSRDAAAVRVNSIDDAFFRTMDIPVLAGRTFTAADTADAPPVAIVNDTLAGHYWPGTPAIGRRVRVLEGAGTVVDVVGVVATTKMGLPGELPQDGIYFPYRQRPRGQMVVLVHTTGESASQLAPLRDLIARFDDKVPVFDVQTMEDFYDARFTALLVVLLRLIVGLGIMGLALTLVGLYGLVSYGVSERTREIGIRIAIGATSRRILTMVLRQGMVPAWLGLAAGLVLSVTTAGLLVGLVPALDYQVRVETYFVVVPLIVMITLAAAFLPARRAARVDPTTALRCE